MLDQTNMTMAAMLLTLGVAPAFAEPISVRYPQGSAHGFVEVTTLDGKRIGTGDLIQKVGRGRVTSRLTLGFLDGSLDDDTTVFSQSGAFRFISDHHVQRGPSFPHPSDTMVDARSGMVTVTNEERKVSHSKIRMPSDVYNGMVSTIVMNLQPSTDETKISVVIPLSTPRLANLAIRKAGTLAFSMGGNPRKAQEYVVHVELGPVADIVAPLIGKEPADYRVWILNGEMPAFIREEGQFYVGGPIWRVQQISAAFTTDSAPAR